MTLKRTGILLVLFAPPGARGGGFALEGAAETARDGVLLWRRLCATVRINACMPAAAIALIAFSDCSVSAGLAADAGLLLASSHK
jgi:hypothetical protein